MFTCIARPKRIAIRQAMELSVAYVEAFAIGAERRRSQRGNEKHSANVKTSWYGESIGQDDTLVVDTIGLDERTWVDGFDAADETASRH